jgi:branched-chain amino acid aminotransferase
MGLARARQIKVVERAIMPDELGKAQEVFLTGTAAEVTPVREIGPYKFTPARICKQMVEDFEKATRA